MIDLPSVDWIVEIGLALYTFGFVLSLIVWIGFCVMASLERFLWPEKEPTLFLRVLTWNEKLASKNLSDYRATLEGKNVPASEEIDYLPGGQSPIGGE